MDHKLKKIKDRINKIKERCERLYLVDSITCKLIKKRMKTDWKSFLPMVEENSIEEEVYEIEIEKEYLEYHVIESSSIKKYFDINKFCFEINSRLDKIEKDLLRMDEFNESISQQFNSTFLYRLNLKMNSKKGEVAWKVVSLSTLGLMLSYPFAPKEFHILTGISFGLTILPATINNLLIRMINTDEMIRKMRTEDVILPKRFVFEKNRVAFIKAFKRFSQHPVDTMGKHKT